VHRYVASMAEHFEAILDCEEYPGAVGYPGRPPGFHNQAEPSPFYQRPETSIAIQIQPACRAPT
jgi:hypothetical protein